VTGIAIGHFLLNLTSPLGWLDLLAVPLFVPAKLLIMKYGVKAVPLHVLSVGVYVAWMLNYIIGLPFIISFVTVTVGEAIAEIVLGVPLTYAIKKRYNKIAYNT